MLRLCPPRVAEATSKARPERAIPDVAVDRGSTAASIPPNHYPQSAPLTGATNP